MRIELRELQNLFETSQKERAELELELLSCREELEKLTEERQVGLSLTNLEGWVSKGFKYEAARWLLHHSALKLCNPQIFDSYNIINALAHMET